MVHIPKPIYPLVCLGCFYQSLSEIQELFCLVKQNLLPSASTSLIYSDLPSASTSLIYSFYIYIVLFFLGYLAINARPLRNLTLFCCLDFIITILFFTFCKQSLNISLCFIEIHLPRITILAHHFHLFHFPSVPPKIQISFFRSIPLL